MSRKPNALSVLIELYRRGVAAGRDVSTYRTRQPVEELARRYPQFAGHSRACPRCGLTKDILTDFGLRPARAGKRQPQSYCRACRSETSYVPKKQR
jgi:hypothetical protein